MGDLALLVFLGLAFVSAKTKCAKCAVGFRVTHNMCIYDMPIAAISHMCACHMFCSLSNVTDSYKVSKGLFKVLLLMPITLV